MSKRQKINFNLESLFPSENVTVGDQFLVIKPLNISQLAIIARKLKGFGIMLSEDGITWENFNSPENLLKIAVVLLEQFPEVVAEAANIDLDDLKLLPLEIIISILNTVLDVNLKSKENLEGNFQSLISKFNQLEVKTQK